jgi:hypothetical protein
VKNTRFMTLFVVGRRWQREGCESGRVIVFSRDQGMQLRGEFR